jgi:hypothetical protein
MTRVFISQLEQDGIRNHKGPSFNTTDIYGHDITIDGKTAACIKKALNENIFQAAFGMTAFMLKENLNFHSSSKKTKFLDGTKNYYN